MQGGVTSALFNALVAEDLPGPGSVFLNVNWDFKAPVRPGDEITAEAVVLGASREKPISTLRTTITNQDGIVVLDGTASSTRPRYSRGSHDAITANGSSADFPTRRPALPTGCVAAHARA